MRYTPAMPSKRTPPSVRLRRLGARLRELREAAGLTQEVVAERTGKDRSTLYRLETAQQRPQRSTLIQLLDLYGVDEERKADLLTLLKEAKQRGWLHSYSSEIPEVYSDYIAFEDEARSISNYESLLIPGLLQTEAYARAQLRGSLPHASEEEVEARVEARTERQALLVKEGAPKLWAIMDEAVLRRVVGSRNMMRDQVAYLLQMRLQPNVTIQVLPFGAGAHPGMVGSFVILDFPDADDQSIVYIESAAGGLFLEEDTEIRRYKLMFEHLRAAASGLDATAALLSAITAEI
jgi:transcriptional regulator with XRE-family HTH domain